MEINRERFTHKSMTDKLSEILKKYTSNMPKKVDIKLPQLKKIDDSSKVKLPKLEKV